MRKRLLTPKDAAKLIGVNRNRRPPDPGGEKRRRRRKIVNYQIQPITLEDGSEERAWLLRRGEPTTASFLAHLDNYDRRWLQGQKWLFEEKKPRFNLHGEKPVERRLP